MIYIIRHGKTELNKAKVLQGRSDFPLNEEGIRQAEEAAARLGDVRFAHVYSSPLIRAVQTAEIIAPQIKPVIDERLIEMDYGPYEGTDLTHLSFLQRFYSQPGSGRDGAAVISHRQSRCISGRYPAPPGKYPDFNARNCDERSAGIFDPGVAGQENV